MAKKNSNSIQSYRQIAFTLQSGLCYYCKQPMWDKNKISFISKFGMKPKSANFLQCTAEHLVARKDGGKNTKVNIVAACKYCNHTRHKAKTPLNPKSYKQYVQKRILNKRWHGLILN